MNETLRRSEPAVVQPFLSTLHQLSGRLLPPHSETSSAYAYGRASIKLSGRVALCFLSITSHDGSSPGTDEEVEVVLSDLLSALAGKVRYSSSPNVAPLPFCSSRPLIFDLIFFDRTRLFATRLRNTLLA